MPDQAPHTDDHGTDSACGSGTRNRYFRGKTMKADDFEKEQGYFIGRRRLLTRSVLGWGVVYGLAVEGSHEEPREGARQPRETETEAADDGQLGSKPCKDPKPITVGPGLAIDPYGREIEAHGDSVLGPKN